MLELRQAHPTVIFLSLLLYNLIKENSAMFCHAQQICSGSFPDTVSQVISRLDKPSGRSPRPENYLMQFAGKTVLVKYNIISFILSIYSPLISFKFRDNPPSAIPVIAYSWLQVNHHWDTVGLLQQPCLLKDGISRSSLLVGVHEPV